MAQATAYVRLNRLGKAIKFHNSWRRSTTGPRNDCPIRQDEAVLKAAEIADVFVDASNALGIQAQDVCVGQCCMRHYERVSPAKSQPVSMDSLLGKHDVDAIACQQLKQGLDEKGRARVRQ